MGVQAKFATQGQAKAEGWFSRRHQGRDAHSAARDARNKRELDKEILAERKNKKRTTPRFEKAGAGLFKHVDNGHTYKVSKTIGRKEVEIPENTLMARRLRREVANAA